MEKVSFLPKYQRNTKRLVARVMYDFSKPYSVINIAQMHNISPGVATRIFDRISYPRPKLARVISIDEFKGNAERIKFQCILTDPVKRKVLDILPSKRTDDILVYFGKYSIKERSKVEFIVMDMSPQFMDIMRSCFPNAKVVVDKFHVCRHITWAIENVRKREQKGYGNDKRRYFKRSRWIILKHGNQLKEDELLQLEGMFKSSLDLREAYALKECFYEFMSCKDLKEAKLRLAAWNYRVGLVNLKEFDRCFQTVNRWQPYILRAFSTGYTNGYTEGVNNKIKVLKRISYGVRNFERFRNRILHLMAA
jgi:transposase